MLQGKYREIAPLWILVQSVRPWSDSPPVPFVESEAVTWILIPFFAISSRSAGQEEVRYVRPYINGGAFIL